MWIARNKDLSWTVSFLDIPETDTKPVRLEDVGTWGVMGDFFCNVPNDSPFFKTHFGNLKWEDDPIEVSLINKDRKSIKSIFGSCTKGLSEDVNGEFYTIYDIDKIIDILLR